MQRVTKQAAVVGGVILLVIVVALLLVPHYTRRPLVLPKELGILQLQQLISGDQARRIINQMHGKGVTPRNNIIGLYASDLGEATLYLSEYEEEVEASETEERMIRGIQTGYTPFSDFQQQRIEGINVSFCTGDGQAHYFFSYNTSLYWLAVDFPIAEETVRALLRTIKPSPVVV